VVALVAYPDPSLALAFAVAVASSVLAVFAFLTSAVVAFVASFLGPSFFSPLFVTQP